MAKQDGILPLKGTIDNITFYKSKNGYIARKKGGIDASRIATDPAFERTRENGAEFQKSASAGQTLRNALRSLLQNVADGNMTSRLSRQMMKVIKADATNPRGRRNVIDGEAVLLESFEFNENGKLFSTFYAPYTATIDRAGGQLKVDIPAFIPKHLLNAAASSTHFKITSAGVEADFENKKFVVDIHTTGELLISTAATEAISLVNTVTPGSAHPLFITLGIEFFQETNGESYPLKNKAFNALAIVKVSGE